KSRRSSPRRIRVIARASGNSKAGCRMLVDTLKTERCRCQRASTRRSKQPPYSLRIGDRCRFGRACREEGGAMKTMFVAASFLLVMATSVNAGEVLYYLDDGQWRAAGAYQDPAECVKAAIALANKL